MLYGRREILDALPAYKLLPADDRFETGTRQLRGPRRVDRGGRVHRRRSASAYGGADPLTSRARSTASSPGWRAIRAYEMDLFRHLVDGLEAIPGLRLFGITDRARFDERTPTAAITLAGVAPRAVAEALGAGGSRVWDGDFYATGPDRAARARSSAAASSGSG